MKIPLTKYGWPQVFVFPAIILAAMAAVSVFASRVLPEWGFYSILGVLAIFLIWTLTFFRDPPRRCTIDEKNLVSPADGKITAIEMIEDDAFIGGEAIRVSIFLSIFNAHINRSPCAAHIVDIQYKRGKKRNAAMADSARTNESNELRMSRLDEPQDKFVVRQISGAIARRIVCKAKKGQKLAGGEKFGMIKFGSRTELCFPRRDDVKILVKVGERVKAGVSILLRYK